MQAVILTESRYENPKDLNPYIENVLLEDSLVAEALMRRNFEVLRKDWNSSELDWAEVDVAIFRSTWDYFDRFGEFSKWLEETRDQTRFVNPYSLIKWNMDKHYLLDLREKGVQIPATLALKKGNQMSLAEVFHSTDWKEAILKPMVSGAARHTYRLEAGNIEQHGDIYAELIQSEDFMLQEFQQNILQDGEVSMMVFGGKYSHAILKRAKKGDFRVQDDFGGTVHPYTPTVEEIEFAERVALLCEPVPVYARVDLTWDAQRAPVLMELELIEPELWFRFAPKAADLMAEALVNYLRL